MAGKDDDATPAGWYRQQEDPGTLRWWDGEDWTDDTMPAPPDAGERASARSRERDGRARATTADRGAAAGTRVEAAPAVPTERSVVVPPATDRGPRRAASGPPAAARRLGPPAQAAPVRQPAGRPARPAGRSPRPEPAPAIVRPTPGPERRRTDPSPRPGPGPRPPQRPTGRPSSARPGDRRGPDPRTSSAGRRPSARPDGREPARIARSGDRVVRRPAVAPPAVRVGVRALLLALAVGVLYLGYVQLRDAEPPPARTLPDEVPEVVEEEGARPVAEALLTLQDLPRGWAAQAHDPGVDDICNGRIPRSVIEPLEAASAGFTMGDAGPFITNIVTRFADEGAAEDFLDLTETTVASCRQYDADQASVRLGPLDYPRFGDDTFVASVSGESPFGPISGTIVYVRVGRRVGSIETIAFGDAEVSDELVERLANLLSRRL